MGVFALAAGTSHAVPPYSHAATGVTLPANISGFEAGAPETYHGTAGDTAIAIPYTKGRVAATLYFRRFDKDKDSTAVAVVAESLTVIKELEKRGMYSNVRVLKRADDSDLPGWAEAAFSATDQHGPLVSYVYATVRQGHVIKLRITTSDLKTDAPGAFVTELQKIVDASRPRS